MKQEIHVRFDNGPLEGLSVLIEAEVTEDGIDVGAYASAPMEGGACWAVRYEDIAFDEHGQVSLVVDDTCDGWRFDDGPLLRTLAWEGP